MTKQSNDNMDAPLKRPPGDYIRRADGSWNLVPLVLGVLVIAAAAYVFWGDPFAAHDPLSAPPIERTTK